LLASFVRCALRPRPGFANFRDLAVTGQSPPVRQGSTRAVASALADQRRTVEVSPGSCCTAVGGMVWIK